MRRLLVGAASYMVEVLPEAAELGQQDKSHFFGGGELRRELRLGGLVSLGRFLQKKTMHCETLWDVTYGLHDLPHQQIHRCTPPSDCIWAS
jgi:hypothetical protein